MSDTLHGQPPNTAKQIRAIVCDDAPELRALFRIELEADGDIEVVGLAGDGEEAIDLARRLHPEVVLLDLSMPGQSGLDAIGALLAENPAASILILSGSADEALQRKALEHGALRYLSKRTPAAELRHAVRQAASSG